MINIVIDRSGSMAENGKPMLILNLVRFFRQYFLSNDIKFYVLQNQLSQVPIDPALDITLPEIIGSIDMDSCIAFLIGRKTESTILLSDGFFELTESQKRVFKQQQNLIIVAVGADADLIELDYLGLPIYLAQDIRGAINHAKHLLDVQQIFPPLQRKNVQFSESVVSVVHEQDEDDDWD